MLLCVVGLSCLSKCGWIKCLRDSVCFNISTCVWKDSNSAPLNKNASLNGFLVCTKMPSTGRLGEARLIVALPAVVVREDISLTCFKVLSEVFIKMFEVILAEQSLKIKNTSGHTRV